MRRSSRCARQPAMPWSSARSRRSGSRPCGCSRPPQTSRAEPASISTPWCKSSSRSACWREDAHLGSVDELLGALEGASGKTARLIDIPPLELAALRQSLVDIRADASSLPAAADLASLYDGLRATAARERRSVLEVSTGIGIAFFNSARLVGRQHVLEPYKKDLRPLRDEGFGAYAARVSRPYAEAVARHFDPERRTLTERGISRARGET